MRGMLKEVGSDGFKQMQAARRKGTAQGEARRKQIEKVVVDGDKAAPGMLEVPQRVKNKDGWKVAK